MYLTLADKLVKLRELKADRFTVAELQTLMGIDPNFPEAFEQEIEDLWSKARHPIRIVRGPG